MELSTSRFNAGAHHCFLFWIGVFGWLCFAARLRLYPPKALEFLRSYKLLYFDHFSPMYQNLRQLTGRATRMIHSPRLDNRR